MAETVLGGAIGFLAEIGIYDVVLPFLLVFTLMFSFLEKTKVLGLEVVRDNNGTEHTYTRKNMNALVAFTTAFFVVASSQIVRIISEVMANVIILVVAGVAFMLAVGVTHTGNKEFDIGNMGKGWKTGFWVVNAIGILVIFLNALGWLDAIYQFFLRSATSSAVATVLMIAAFIGFMAWITTTKAPKKSESSD